jgi:hypothetical protein
MVVVRFLCCSVAAAAVLLVTTASPSADQISVQGVRVPSVSVPRVPTPGTPGSKINPVANSARECPGRAPPLDRGSCRGVCRSRAPRAGLPAR